jgi:hypothetical protein
MQWRRYLLALALCPALGRADAEPPAPPTQQRLAARLDLTQLAVLQADYVRAAGEKNHADLTKYDGEVMKLLDEAVPPEEREARAPTDAGAWNDAGLPGDAPSEAARDDGELIAYSRQFAELAGKVDQESVNKKLSILGSLHSMCERAFYPTPGLERDEQREKRQETRGAIREQNKATKLPGQ